MELPPLPRWLSLNYKGRDVRALQRALRRAGFRPRSARITNLFDADVDAQLRAFQTARGLEVDGVLGPDSYAALGPFYDARGRWLVAKAAEVLARAPETVRERIVAAAKLGYDHRDEIAYSQELDKRMEGVRKGLRPPAFPRVEDCSSFVTWCYFAADAPDPNGSGYDGFGNTDTQLEHGVEVDLASARLGDLVFYGSPNAPDRVGHVAVYVGNGQVVSHGSPPGPLLLAADYRPPLQVRSYAP